MKRYLAIIRGLAPGCDNVSLECNLAVKEIRASNYQAAEEAAVALFRYFGGSDVVQEIVLAEIIDMRELDAEILELISNRQ